tara:strand:- start:208 stop:702 length:495 start_codon:yes stop_codon:yes gene_type:complete
MIKIKNKGKEPVIYIRYHKEKVLYVGETDDYRKGRPFRDESKIGDWDQIKLLKSSSSANRRRYWEAYLICRLKPVNQDTTKYFALVKKQNESTNLVVDLKQSKEWNLERLDNLRRKNNKERLSYWLGQAEMAKIHFKESTKCALHFWRGYKEDQNKITAKSGKT